MRLFKTLFVAATLCSFCLARPTPVLCDDSYEAPPAPKLEERVDPAGITGSLVLAGSNVPDEALQTFFDLAKGKRARVVVLRTSANKGPQEITVRLLNAWETKNAGQLEVLRVGSESGLTEEAITNRLEAATGVWLAGSGEDLREQITSAAVRRGLATVMQNGGVVGGASPNAALLGENLFADQATAAVKAGGLALLPQALVDVNSTSDDSESRLPTALEQLPGVVGYEIPSDAAIVIRGRRLKAVGDGVQVYLSAGKDRPASQLRLEGRGQFADLTALRLSARYRTEAAFPSKKPPAPVVENGTLIIIGGGGMPKGIVDRFVELAGGEEAKIVVLPTAQPDPIVVRQRGISESFRRAGAKSAVVLPGRTLEKVESEEYVKAFKEATGIWFGGGRQWRFADAYLGTKVHALMHDVLNRGGVIMGSSAGASIQADYLARANPLGNRDIMAEGYERGLAFLKGAAVDQHFAQRGRFKDMTQLVERYPQLLGIGIDETTAIVVQKNIAEVVGRGGVHFYDRRQPVEEGKPDHQTVRAGGRYDLVARKALDEDKDAEAKDEKADKNADEKEKAEPAAP